MIASLTISYKDPAVLVIAIKLALWTTTHILKKDVA